MKRGLSAALITLTLLSTLPGAWAQDTDWQGVHQRAVDCLRGILAQEKEWVRVHAAEALLRHGCPEGVEALFLPDIDTAPPKHRIGVWRVLAQAQTSAEAREQYVARIRNAFCDPEGPDRLHAVETLSKLKDAERPAELLRVAREETSQLQAYAAWAVANSGIPDEETAFVALLNSDEPNVRTGVAYGLRFFPRIQPASFEALKKARDREPSDSRAGVYLTSALYVHVPEDEAPALRKKLDPYLLEGAKEQKYEACAALARRGDMNDVPTLLQLLEDPEPDVRVGAADALLSIEKRSR